MLEHRRYLKAPQLCNLYWNMHKGLINIGVEVSKDEDVPIEHIQLDNQALPTLPPVDMSSVDESLTFATAAAKDALAAFEGTGCY